MAVRSRRVGTAVVAVGATGLLYTVPAGRTLVVRSLTAHTPTAAGPHYGAWLINGGHQLGVLVPTGTASVLTNPMILNPGDTLQFFAQTGLFVASAYGALLFGAPA